MALTSIGDQLTPGRPIEVTFAAETGIPSANQEVLLFGHAAATGMAGSGTATIYQVTAITNAGDLDAATTEANLKFGSGSELAKMVIAAVKANSGASTFPALKCVPLLSTDTAFGAADAALVAGRRVKQEFAVSPYDGQTDAANLTKLKDYCVLISGAQRVQNNQFGTIGVASNYTVSDPSTLVTPDSQYLSLMWFKSSVAPTYSIGELAAAYAARVAGGAIPFNPLDSVAITGIDAQAALSDRITVGAGLESETALQKGWTPLKTTASNVVQIVRSVTTRITSLGTGVGTHVGAYYDVQDFQVLYFWRKTLFTRFNQSDFSQVKASVTTGDSIKSEAIRLAKTFEDQNMFQSVAQLAKLFLVERSASDRSRFDLKTPVNVIPGLHVIGTNIVAGTLFDTFTI